MDSKRLKKQYADEVQAHLEKLRETSYRIFYAYHGEGQGLYKNNSLEAGFSIFLDDTIMVRCGKIYEHDTKLVVKLPLGTIARIEPSEKLMERGIHLVCPTLSSAHDNHIKVYLNNLTNNYMPHNNQVFLYKGTKLATLIMEPHSCEYFLQKMELE